MAEKTVLLKIDVQGNKELERLQANFDKSTRDLKRLKQAEKDGTLSAKQINAERARGSLELIKNRNALNDQRAAILKNNNALRQNSGFVAGVRKGVAQWATSMIGVTVAIAAVTKLVGSAVKIFKDFQEANSKLAAVTRASTQEMALMKDQAKALGSVTAFTASEVTGLQIEFAKLGFPTNEILKMTEATLAGAAALGSDLGEQAALTGALLKQYGLDAAEAGRVNDVMAEAAASSALDFSKLATALPIVGATANAVGVDLEKTTALLGTLSDRGLDASTSGTALRNVFLELSKQGLTMEQAMDKINNSTDKAKTSMQLFGKRGATAGLILAETGDQVEDLEIKLNGANGAAQAMADTMLDNLAGDITIANSAWEGFILSLEDGEGVISETLRGFTQMGTSILSMATSFNEAESAAGSFINAGTDYLVSIGAITEEQGKFNKNLENSALVIEALSVKMQKGDITTGQFKEAVKAIGDGWVSTKKQIEDAGVLEATGEEGEDKSGDKAAARAGQKEAKKQDSIKAARIKGQQEAQAAIDALEIKAIEDDRVRKEVELQAEFDNKIAKITGDSEVEKELRLRLAEELQTAINEQKAVFAEEDRLKEEEELQIKNTLKLETELIEAEDDLVKQGEILERRRALELDNEKLTVEQKDLINAEFNQKQRAREKALADFKKQQDIELAQSAANLAGALSGLAKEGSDEAKAAAIVQAGINGALAITQALAQLGPVAGAIAAVGIGITTGVQIAKISSAKFARGGMLEGARHSEGGIPFTIDGVGGFEAEGGEAIMTRNAVKMFGAELSAMNVAGGGVPFERGGRLVSKFQSGGSLPSTGGVTSSQQQANINNGMSQFAEDIIEGINSKEVINVSTNTTDVAREVTNIASQATF